MIPPSSLAIDIVNEVFSSSEMRIFFVDAVDVVDVSVSEFVLSSPGGHLAFSGIVSNASANSCCCRRGFWAHQHSNEEPNVWRSVIVQFVWV